MNPEEVRLERLTAGHAERMTISAMIARPELIDEILAVVRVSDFCDPNNAALAEIVQAIHAAGKVPTMARVVAALKKTPGSPWLRQDALGELLHGRDITAGGDALFYAQQVAEGAMLRRIDDAAAEIRQDVMHGIGEEVDAIASRAAERMAAACEDTRRSGAVHIAEPLSACLVELDARLSGERRAGGVLTGFSGLDGLLCGLRPGQLIVLAARPSVGKSAMAIQIATEAAMQAGPVLLCSLEMSAAELGDRLLSQRALVGLRRMQDGTISAEDRRAVVAASGALAELPLHVVDSGDVSVQDVLAAARRIKRRAGSLALVVIDYLQLLRATKVERGVSREQQVSDMSRQLKLGARALECPILCLAQLNREAEKVGEPRLSHLRESGAIEQDADVVAFVHREGEAGAPEAKYFVIVAKQRSGPTGRVEIAWHRDTVRFADMVPEKHAALAAWNDQEEGGDDGFA